MIPDTLSSLFWGYTVIWGLLSAYILWLGFKLRKIENKLADFQSRIESDI